MFDIKYAFNSSMFNWVAGISPVRQTRLNRGNYRTGESAIFAPENSPDQEYLAQ